MLDNERVAKEVERKYLVRNERWRQHAEDATPYRQGYLSTEPDRSVRVRIAGDKALLTIKGRSEGASRDEFEYSIPHADAQAMLADLCLKPLIEKTRHRVPHGGVTWEVDEFEGENRGLIVAELETDEETARRVEKPDWLGDEVTGDARYFNVSLVRLPYLRWNR